MSGIEFHNSGHGRRYFEHQLPEQIKAMKRLAKAIERQNELAERKESNQNVQ